jgi:hypothetical protein
LPAAVPQSAILQVLSVGLASKLQDPSRMIEVAHLLACAFEAPLHYLLLQTFCMLAGAALRFSCKAEEMHWSTVLLNKACRR